ncbi:MAG TPA: diguanylate cyclase [Anaerolineales bacterium]|nr:diguanylate cyclase [Anaerolineales bacterium]
MSNKPATILIADDTLENVTLLSRILNMNGYQVITARDGSETLDLVFNNLPDLVLLDVKMPVMDGFEVCARIKEDESCREIPIIFISALDDPEDKVRAFRAGGVDYIIKPFDYEEVQARVETHLILRRLRLQLEQANRELAVRVEELTESQRQLADRERRLSAFVSALPNLSFVLDDDGRYLEVLASETSFLVAQPRDLIGRLMEEVMPPKAAALIMDAIHHTIETGNIQVIEYKIPVLAGGERWFEGRIALMEKNERGHSKVVLIATEISERVQLYQEVQRLANLDVLTGCYNRRHFMTLASQEIQRAMRYKRPLSFLMMDIDHFKGVNDQHGHQIGDQLLCSLVVLCQKQLRTVDILGRYGGEEFVVLMPETAAEGALKASERLRAKIEKMKINLPAGKLSVTVSMGLASLARGFDERETLDSLIKSADRALYAAKAAGRNCVRTF